MKDNPAAIISGIVSGVITSLASILAMAAVFHLSYEEYVTMLPKSITTAIGTAKAMEIGETEGAMSSLSIVVSGILTVIGASVFAGFI